MKTELTTHLESIGINGPFLKRAELVLDFYEQIFPNQIEDIFVSNYFDKDGNRQFENMWLFSKRFIMEAKNFLQEDDFDSVPLRKQVKYWSIKKTEYNFTDATSKSRMTVDFILLSEINGILKASGENCNYLKSLFMKHILPNAIENYTLAQQVDQATAINRA